jgi:Cys-tRNA(Pro) deacylase
MKAPEIPVTRAVRALRAAGVEFTPHPYPYVERGGTRQSSASLGVAEHRVIKTIVLEATGDGGRVRPLIVLMHGDREISTRQLARTIGVKTIVPASEAAVERHTGYQPGGVSPFGTRAALPIYVEESVLALDRVYINGGRRGFLVAVAPVVLTQVLAATPVQVAASIPER